MRHCLTNTSQSKLTAPRPTPPSTCANYFCRFARRFSRRYCCRAICQKFGAGSSWHVLRTCSDFGPSHRTFVACSIQLLTLTCVLSSCWLPKYFDFSSHLGSSQLCGQGGLGFGFRVDPHCSYVKNASWAICYPHCASSVRQ